MSKRMTKEEAIKILDKERKEYIVKGCELDKAIGMVIEALKQPSDTMQLLDDGTLKVKVANVLDIKRIMVMDDNVIYDSYYPDRPKGEWIVSENGKYITCSNCGLEMFHSDWAYCPNCGADMRGEVM